MFTTHVGLGTRFLRTLRTGAQLGLPAGLVLVLAVLLADDSHVNFLAWAITLCVGAMSGALGLLLWLGAALYTWYAHGYVNDAPTSHHRMVLERGLLGLGAAATCLPISIVALARGESLF